MLEYENRPATNMHPGLMLLLIFITLAIGFVVVGPLLGIILSVPFYEGSILEMLEKIQSPVNHPEIKIPLYITQGGATLFGLIIGPFILMKSTGIPLFGFFRERPLYAIPVLLTPIIVLVSMSVNSVFIDWNANVHFPEFMKGFEDWAREKEDFATEVTEFLTKFDSIGEVVLAIIVIAVLPAIGEELVFRGLIQNQLMRASGNIHVSVWVAAILFSAIHMQFFGFVPRLLLGALFGYLYYWSGNLSIPILAHFVNNGSAVIGLYLYQQGKIEHNMEETDAVPWPIALTCTIITAALLFYFQKYYREHREMTEQ